MTNRFCAIATRTATFFINREGLCEGLVGTAPRVARRLEPAADHPAVGGRDRQVRVEKVRVFFCGQLEQP